MEMSCQFLFNTVFLHLLLLSGGWVNALPYDYSATIECLNGPLRPQYDGGIIQNPEFNGRLNGWSTFGGGKLEVKEAGSGNKFLVSRNRSQPHHGPSQKVHLEKTKLYTLSAWVQVSNENDVQVYATFKTKHGFVRAGYVFARSGCWSMMKGGLSVNVTGTAELYFETRNASDVEIWIDSVSLQPFSKQEWSSHQQQSIENVRKKRVRFEVKDANGNPQSNATISIVHKNSGFPFGCAINRNILTSTAYQQWFTSRGFTVTTFENEMKWYSNERSQGQEDYTLADAMLFFAKQHCIAVRGHNVFWNDPRYQMAWVKALSKDQLQAAVDRRINSVVNRYKGQVIAWDVVNENLHFSFLEDTLDQQASSVIYQKVSQLDTNALLFMNEYNTLEDPTDPKVTPALYLSKMKAISNFVGNGRLAIGLEGHFHTLNLAYMRSALDTLTASGFPVWLTEVDVTSGPTQASIFEEVLREGHSHPGVKGIVIWSAWNPSGCYAMCLTDNNFKNLPTGDVVDKLIGEWRSTPDSSSVELGKADTDGFFEAVLFHGDYSLTVNHPTGKDSSTVNISVVPDGAASEHVEIVI